MRVNPRTVLLAALQEEPRPERILGTILWQHAFLTGRDLADWQICARLQRHLCHLIRQRKVARLADGRYALRVKRAFVFPQHKGLGTVDVRIAGADAWAAATRPADMAERIHEYLNTTRPAPGAPKP